ncbi:MAG: hypothetical protein OEV26_01775 [Gallionella sp.]|nr:hypothetical protein [Gallionella sp.]MDH4286135.1 hypothetical protein [Gallionella sp.]
MNQLLISSQVQHTSLRGAKRRGNPDDFKHKGILFGWIAALPATFCSRLKDYSCNDGFL